MMKKTKYGRKTVFQEGHEKGKKIYAATRRGSGNKNIPVKRNPFLFILEILGLCILLLTVSYAPQLIFAVQDGILWGQPSLSQRESMDVETLSTTYESSLARRMMNYAEGLAAGDRFYVTSRSLTPGENLYQYINSEQGLYQDMIFSLADNSLLDYLFLDELASLENCMRCQWKQYVIYSEDYTKGVNFILWYIEYKNSKNEVIKILTDAESGVLYALKTEGSVRLSKPQIGMWSVQDPMAIWSYFASFYEATAASEVLEMENKLWEQAGYVMEYYEMAVKEGSDLTTKEDIQTGSNFVQSNAGYEMSENALYCRLPYGENSMDVEIIISKENAFYSDKFGISYYLLPDMVIGVRQIYEMIPEFA